MVWEPEVGAIEERRALAKRMGGAQRAADQPARGRLRGLERTEKLFGGRSFDEHGSLAGSGEYVEGQLVDFLPASFVTGIGKIDGRPVAVGGGDFTARSRPSEGRVGSKSDYSEEMALGLQVPLVRLID